MNSSINDENIKNVDFLLQQKENFIFSPTPCHKLKNLSESQGGPNIYIKRDDMTGLAMGGNKARKLEYLIYEAMENKCDSIITIGCAQSNHCRQTAAACALYKLECFLILVQVESLSNENNEGNILLDKLLGANISFFEDNEKAREYIPQLINNLKEKGRNPYFIPTGGSNATGILGYVSAYKEILADQKKLKINFDYIFFGSSSLGTHAGLVLGNILYGNPTNNIIHGISICKSFLDSDNLSNAEEKIIKLIQEFDTKYGTDIYSINESILKENNIIFDQRFNKTGYAIVSNDDRHAIELFAKSEAIILDPVYSGRAAAGMLKMIENNEIPKDKNVLFIHTGGAPALFSNIFKY